MKHHRLKDSAVFRTTCIIQAFLSLAGLACGLVGFDARGEAFFLKDENTGSTYGPFDFKEAAIVTLSNTTYKLILNDVADLKTEERPDRTAARTEETLRLMVLPLAKFQEAKMERVVEFLEEETRRLDPDRRGVKIVITPATAKKTAPVTAEFRSISMYDVIQNLCTQQGLKFRIESFGVVIFTRESSG